MRLASILLGTLVTAAACSVKDTGTADSAGVDTAPGPVVSADTSTALDSTATPAAPGAPAAGTASDPVAAPKPATGGSRPATPPATPRPATSGSAPAQASPADTVRGIIAETGSTPVTQVVVRAPGGRVTAISGPLAREIGRASGAELWVRGRRDGQALEATAYAVRTIDGQPAVDGILARDGDRLVLVTAGGRRPIAQPLQALWGMIGARVWLVGPLDGRITSYGVLREP